MPRKAKKQAELHLHCKCDSCKSWEIVFDPETNNYFFKCASCTEKIPVNISLGKPHVSIHWE